MPHHDHPPSPQQILLTATRAIPELDAHAGDYVIVSPGTEHPISVVHHVGSNYGRVLGLFVEDALTPVADVDRAALTRLLSELVESARPALRLLRQAPPALTVTAAVAWPELACSRALLAL